MTEIKISTQNFVIKPVLNVYNGRFYSGMTQEEALQRNIYKRLLRRDFQKIDKNNDGILSDEEILKERVVEKRRAGIGHSMLTAALALWTFTDFNKDMFKTNKVFEICLFALDVSLIAIELLNSIRNFSGLKKAKEELSIYQTVDTNQAEH